MIKIVQISDIHWRSLSRHEEYTDSFKRLFDILRNEIKPDLIVNTGDTVHNKTANISPEILEKLAWMFKELSLIAPTITILGNHDGNLTNLERMDAISPIFNALDLDNSFLLKKSGTYNLGTLTRRPDWNEFLIHVYSPFDTPGWNDISTESDKINLGFFHGALAGCYTDGNFRMTSTDRDIGDFKNKIDFLLAGDIHKMQYMDYRMNKDGKPMPWAAYPGSFCQQNYGESLIKGFLVWDIESKTNWNVEFVELENKQPFLTIPWAGNVENTLENIKKELGGDFLPGSRYRIQSSQPIIQTETKQLINELKDHHQAEEVIFKYDIISKMETVEAAGLTIAKTDLRKDSKAIFDLYKEYIFAHEDSVVLTEDQIDHAKVYIESYLQKLSIDDAEAGIRNVSWSIKKLKFNNLFRYGEGNEINFEKLNGVVGIFAPNRKGKALGLKTEIPTTNGWKTIKTIEVGDFIFTPNGNPTKVIAKSPVYNSHVCYLVKFSDGSEVVADSEHLWQIEDHLSRANKRNIYQILTTRQIKNTLVWREKTDKSAIGYEWSINTCKPIKYKKQDLLIEPYVLGCWLGDGTTANSGFTCADNQIIENLKLLGENPVKHNCKYENTKYAIKMLAPRLRKLGVLNNKHIPEQYMLSSVKDRKELLAGLLDTDGYSCPGSGRIEFCNTNEKLAKQVYELITSLGYRASFKVGDAKLYGRFISKKYRICFMPHEKMFRLDRKNDSINTNKNNHVIQRRFIVSVEEVKREPVQCLVVDDPSHLFLITRSFIPTHNSSIIGSLMYNLFNTTDRGNLKNAHIVNKNKDRASAGARINVGGKDFLIERETIKTVSKKNPESDTDKSITNLKLYGWNSEINQKIEMNSISRDDTDKEIRKLIGTSQDFLLTAFSSQGGMNRFIEEGATQRKAILSRFLDLDMFDKLHSYAKEDYTIYNNKVKRFGTYDWNSSIERLVKEIKEIQKEIKTIESQLEETISSRDELKFWLKEQEKTSTVIDISKIKDIEKNVEKNKIDFTRFTKDLEELKKKEEFINNKLSTIISEKEDVEKLTLSFEKLQKAKEELSDFNNKLSIEKHTLASQEKSVKKLNVIPCGDQYPECFFIKDSHEDKKKIGKQENIVKNLTEKVADWQNEINQYLSNSIPQRLEKAKKQYIEELKLNTEIENVKGQISTKSRQISDTKIIIDNLQQEHKILKEKINETNAIEIDKKRIMYGILVEDIEASEKIHRNLLVKLGGKTENIENIKKEKKEYERDLEELKLFESIQSSFSKTGIPVMILKSQLPSINKELSKILEGVVDFKVYLETDLDSNTLDVYIEDASSKRIIELASGMEKMISSLALRVALINLSSLPKSDVFIMDESWDVLDHDNLQKCLGMFQVLKNYFKSIIIISHVDSIKEVADVLLEIKDDGEFSKVEFK